MTNDDQSSPATAADLLASLDLPPGAAGIPRLLDEVIWHVRNARAATQIITEEEHHPPGNWYAAATRWEHVAILAAELRNRTRNQSQP